MRRFDDPRETIRVSPGDEFAIALAANPTTGYTWQADMDQPSAKLIGQQFEPGGEAVGAGGQEVLRFQARQTGKVQITCTYRRPWGGEAHDVRQFRVVIEL